MCKIVAGIAIVLFPTMIFTNKLPDDVQRAKVMHKAYRMQIPFIENQGQLGSDEVRFYAKTFGGTLFIEKDGTLTYSFASEKKGTAVIKEIVTGEKIEVKGANPSPTKVNYFKGKDKNKWKTNIPSYESVSLGEVYKGVDLTLKAYGKNVEKLFTVSPGENPEKIAIKLEGAKDLKVNKEGELEVITEHGPITFTKPLAYQEINGERIEVDVNYNLLNSKFQSQIPDHISHIPDSTSHISHPTSFSYGFRVGNYDKNCLLNIDPLLANTFIGGSNDDSANSITLDENGNVYVTGFTFSTDYPTTGGAYDESHHVAKDVLVSKFNNDLSSLLASTFIGGEDHDEGKSLAFDDSGNVYVMGDTESSDYPTTASAYDQSYNGIVDVFVSKLSSDLSDLKASTFIGESDVDEGYSVTLDGSEYVYVTGITSSSDYPTTPGAYDEILNGADVFVSKLTSDLSYLMASTFIGGGNFDYGRSIYLDGSGNVYVTGFTYSTDYPTTGGAYDESYNGILDAFVSKLNSDLGSLMASTFIGGGNFDYGRSIYLDGSGNVYVTGFTYSTDYPTTASAYDKSYNGGTYDIFISKLDNTLSFLFQSTFIGGSETESSTAIALDGCGNIYVTGQTNSTDYPTTPSAYDESHNGGFDVFVSKLDSTLSFLFQSTFIGGSDHDIGYFLAIDASGNVYATGHTSSSDYPTTSGAYDESYNGAGPYGYGDVIISKLDSFLSVDNGVLSASSGGFLSAPDVSFVFDADQDGILDTGCTQLLLCEGQIGEVDIWMTGYSGTLESGDLSFNWDEVWLSVLDVTCKNPDWDNCSYAYQGSGEYALHTDDTVGLTGPDIKLHTIRFQVNEIDEPFTDEITATNGSVVPSATVADGRVVINGICGGDEFTCESTDHCERMEECPDTALPDPGSPERYYWEPQDDDTLCKGDTINIFHIKKGYYTVIEEFNPELCDSACFNQCYDNCAHAELHDCYLECVRGCACDVCANWGDEEVCYEYQSRIACSIVCYNQCYYSHDQETQTAEYDKRCGFGISETIRIIADDDEDCETGSEVDSFTLEGVGTPSVSRPLPLDAGTYELCAGNTLIDMVEVEECAGPECKILIPTNLLTVIENIDESVEDIEVETDSLNDGNYTLSLFQWDYDHSETSPAPGSLSIPASVSVSGGSGTFNLSATTPQPVGEENHWINITIRAEKQGGGPICEAALDYDVRMKGDVNDNGVIEVADIQREINIILEVPPPANSYESWAGDFDDSECIDICDVQLTINRFLGP